MWPSRLLCQVGAFESAGPPGQHAAGIGARLRPAAPSTRAMLVRRCAMQCPTRGSGAARPLAPGAHNATPTAGMHPALVRSRARQRQRGTSCRVASASPCSAHGDPIRCPISPPRTLKVGHVLGRAAIERVYHHFAVHGPRDLDAAVPEAGGRRRAAPALVLADRGRLGQEVRQLPGIERPLPRLAAPEQLLAAPVEASVQGGHEHLRRDREYLLLLGRNR